MRAVITLALLGSLGWGGYWFAGSAAQKTALDLWLADRRAAGWVAEAEDLRVTGFPNRFDTVVTNLDLADPQQGWAWHAPDFRIMALSYKPNHIVVAWPETHVFSNIFETVSVSSELQRASVVFKPETSLALDRLQFEARRMQLSGVSGWHMAADAVNAAFVASPELPDQPAYDLYMKIGNLLPPRGWRHEIDPAALLPETIPEIRFDATFIYDRPWDRFAIENRNPLLQSIHLKDTRFLWGVLELRAAGEVAVVEGYAQGKVTLQLRNWRQLLDIARSSGTLSPDIARNVERALGLVAGLAGNPETIEVPLTFKRGNTYIGPVAIADAPYFGN